MSYYGWEKNNPNFPYVFIENQQKYGNWEISIQIKNKNG